MVTRLGILHVNGSDQQKLPGVPSAVTEISFKCSDQGIKSSISGMPHYMPYNFFDFSLEKLFTDQITIP